MGTERGGEGNDSGTGQPRVIGREAEGTLTHPTLSRV